jgi:hypothetical protein
LVEAGDELLTNCALLFPGRSMERSKISTDETSLDDIFFINIVFWKAKSRLGLAEIQDFDTNLSSFQLYLKSNWAN